MKTIRIDTDCDEIITKYSKELNMTKTGFVAFVLKSITREDLKKLFVKRVDDLIQEEEVKNLIGANGDYDEDEDFDEIDDYDEIEEEEESPLIRENRLRHEEALKTCPECGLEKFLCECHKDGEEIED